MTVTDGDMNKGRVNGYGSPAIRKFRRESGRARWRVLGAAFAGECLIARETRQAAVWQSFASEGSKDAAETRDRRRERSGEGARRRVLRVCYGESMERACFDEMSDDRVLERVQVLVRRANQTTAELLGYLAEVEERRLHLPQACSSLFAFCVERLR